MDIVRLLEGRFKMIEHHHTLHYILILLFYNLGQLFSILIAAYIVSQSSVNNINNISHYFKARFLPVMARWFLCTCLFLFVWGNPAVLDIERFMPNFAAHLGVSGILGWFSDSLWDKVLAAVFPGMQKGLPKVPVEDQKQDASK